MWELKDRGFLPPEDPIHYLPDEEDRTYIPLIYTLENLSSVLPVLIEDRHIREEAVFQLRSVFAIYDDYFAFNVGDTDTAERGMLIYSYLASAYVYARHENPANRIPKEIAIPLVRFAERTGRYPILSYASYCLYNWKRLDPNKPIELGNIELLQNFCTPEVGKRDEDWFILVHVDIENKAAPGITAIAGLDEVITEGNEPAIQKAFDSVYQSLVEMNKTLKRMPEECDPDNYFRFIRPYIFGFENIVYEGYFDNKPQSFRGETGAQSSVVPAFLAALGIHHEDSVLMKHLKVMREYMPPPHRKFLVDLEKKSAKQNLWTVADSNPKFRDSYNECVDQLLQFRTQHLEYAINYISKKVDNPKGTGGTPYLPWLEQLTAETEEYLFKNRTMT